MAGTDIAAKKYVVRLSGEEREQLQALIRKGKSPAKRLLKARILLKADGSDAGEGWSDSRIIKALDTSKSMVYRVRKQLVEEGFRSGIEPQTAHDTARCCDFRQREGSQADRHGVLRAAEGVRPLDVAPLLESKVVELGIVERASDSTIGRTLKKLL